MTIRQVVESMVREVLAAEVSDGHLRARLEAWTGALRMMAPSSGGGERGDFVGHVAAEIESLLEVVFCGDRFEPLAAQLLALQGRFEAAASECPDPARELVSAVGEEVNRWIDGDAPPEAARVGDEGAGPGERRRG